MFEHNIFTVSFDWLVDPILFLLNTAKDAQTERMTCSAGCCRCSPSAALPLPTTKTTKTAKCQRRKNGQFSHCGAEHKAPQVSRAKLGSFSFVASEQLTKSFYCRDVWCSSDVFHTASYTSRRCCADRGEKARDIWKNYSFFKKCSPEFTASMMSRVKQTRERG